MTEQQREELRGRINALIEELQGMMQSHTDSSRPVEPDNAIGRITRMDAINAKSISESMLQSAKQRLLRLEAALNRIDNEEFGLCVECEEPIAIKRLLIMPETLLCITCAERRG